MRTIVGCGSRSPILLGWMVSRKVRKGVKNKSGSSVRLRFINPSAPFCRRHNYARHLTWIAQGGSDDSIDETFDLLPSAQWRSCHVSIGIHCVTTWNDSALGWTKQFKRYKSSWTLLQSLGIRCPARWWLNGEVEFKNIHFSVDDPIEGSESFSISWEIRLSLKFVRGYKRKVLYKSLVQNLLS